MEELAIFIIIYAVFLIVESPTKKKPAVDDEPFFSFICVGCIVDNRQELIDI